MTTVKTQTIRSLFFVICSICCLQAITAQKPTKVKKYPATFLWRISGKGMTKPSYLYGTIHLTDKRLFYFGDSLYKAIEQTEGFAIEINPDDMSAMLINSFNRYEKNAGTYVTAGDGKYSFLKNKLEKKYGIEWGRVTKRQAYLSRYEAITGADAQNNMYSFMDVWLYDQARKLGKVTGGIEDLEDQLSLMEIENAEYSIEDYLIKSRGERAGVDRLTKIYLAQDLQAIEELSNESPFYLRDTWLYKRNIKMARRMDSLMKYRNHFFAVGAAHLPGDTGVIQLLRKNGFKVEPVFSGRKITPGDYKIASSKLQWQNFTQVDSLYKVSFPSKSAGISADGSAANMQMCIDIPSGAYFITSVITNIDQTKTKEQVLRELMKGFAGAAKIANSKKIGNANEASLELIVEGDAFMRIRGFVKGSNAFMQVMGHDVKREMLTGEMANRFFSSFSMKEKITTAPVKGLVTFVNEEDAFSVQLPRLPNQPETEKEDGNWLAKKYSVIDVKTNTYYMVIARKTGAGFYVNGDSNYFASQKENWQDILTKVLIEKKLSVDGYPALRYDYVMDGGDEKTITRTMTVIRGNRVYLLLAVRELQTPNDSLIQQFFTSFKLLAYKKTEWKKHISPNKEFSAYTPAPIAQKEMEDEEGSPNGYFYHVSYDPVTAVSYELDKTGYTNYYSAKTDSAVFHDVLHTNREAGDSIISIKNTMNGKNKSQEVLLVSPNDEKIRRIRFIWHGDTMYLASARLHPQLAQLPQVNQYFDELIITKPARPTTLLKNKTKQLLLDLTSGKAQKFEKAAAAITEVEFDHTDLPLLKEAMLKQYSDEEEEYIDIYDNIADAIAGLNDSSVTTFVQKKYPSLKSTNTTQKIAMLRLLALIKTKKSYAVLKELLLAAPPKTDRLFPLQYVISDSLQLTATLFPDVMKLNSTARYAAFITGMANELLDSNLIDMKSLQPYEKNIFNTCQQLYKKLQADKETNIWDASESVHLLGRFNSTAGNELLQKMAALKNKDLNHIILTDLLQNKQKADSDLIEAQAADKAFRYTFYSALHKKGLSSVFPVQYSTQKALAEGDLYSFLTEEDYEIESIVYLKEKVITYKGEQKRFHLFKVKVDDVWQLAVSGPYGMNEKELLINDGEHVCGVYWSEVYDAKETDKQFDAYIKEMEK